METREELSPQDLERQVLEGMRNQFEGDGYTFTVAPSPDKLPEFLRSYELDAIAQKAGQNVAIEIKRRQSTSTTLALQHLRNLFVGHPEWQLRVIYTGSDPADALSIGRLSVGDLRQRVSKVEELVHSGELQAAFVLSWSLLEATLRTVDRETSAKARTPGTVVQTLGMEGYITEDLQKNLRSIIGLRNRVVHGDLAAEPSFRDVQLVLEAVNEVLASPSLVN
jgi:uncharacterized protein YutE (UPF0331/DUF86 family)